MTLDAGWKTADPGTFFECLDQVAGEAEDRVFAHFDDRSVTYGEMLLRVQGVANQLLALGVEPGDGVALMTANCPEFVDVSLAAARIGAVCIPVNTAFSGDFLVHQLKDSRASLILVDEAFLSRVLDAAPALPDLRLCVVRSPVESASTTTPSPAIVPSAMLYDGETDRCRGGRPLRWDEPSTILYTSGTTGPSKGALVTQHYLLGAARSLMDGFRVGADEIVYGALPLFHFGGAVSLVMGALVRGGTSVIDSAFHPQATWDRVRRYHASVMFGAGPMVVMLWSLPARDDDKTVPVRLIVAAPIPPELHEPIEERFGCAIRSMYGMTEAFPVAIQPVDRPPTLGGAGIPTPNFDVRLFDDNDAEVPHGEPGEIALRPRSPHAMFEGYAGRPEATLDQFRNLWFHTGDLARWDESGQLVFVDRKKDAIRRRGENISSFEIEQAVLQHAEVAECACHAVPSPLGEDDVKICVVRSDASSLSPQDLVEHCAVRLPKFAIPRYIEFVEQLPKTVTGRVKKNELRGRPMSPATWDAER